MPRKYELSWEGHPHYRWVKMYRRVRYRVTCEQLNLPNRAWTKELSYQAANDWWLKKRAEIDGQLTAEHPHAEKIAELQQKLGYAGRHGLHDVATETARQIQQVSLLPADESPDLDPITSRRLETARLLGIAIPDDLDPHALAMIFGDGKVWGERFGQERFVPVDRTIGGLADQWAALKATEAKSGIRSADGADNLRIALEHFKTFAGSASPVESITAETWHNWYVRCAGLVAAQDNDPDKGWSADYGSKVFGISRSFVRWLWEREVLPSLPRNLEAKQYRFQRPAKAIPTFTNDEVNVLLRTATGQHRLHLLLMLNTGMTQKDISDLRKDQIDLRARFIERRRSKTAKQKNTPLIRYPLWPETKRLLQEHLSEDPIYALLTQKGRRWVRKELREDNTLKKADNIATLFQHLRRKIKMTGAGKSLKIFRKTSATRLNGEPRYRDLRFWFLGHTARTVADRHYAAESQALLAEAIQWLGDQYGL